MRTQGSWQRWCGASQSRRPESSRCIVRGVETLERRDLLSAVVGSAATNTIEPALLDAAVLTDVGVASSAPMAAMTQPAGISTATVQPPLSKSLPTAIHLSVSQQSAKIRQSLLLSDDATVGDWDWSPAAVDMVLEGA